MKRKSLRPEHWIIICVLGLTILGVAILSSASAIIAYKNFGNNDYYFWHQIKNIIMGIICLIIFTSIPYKKWAELSPVIIIGGIISLILVFIPGLKSDYGTAHSWIMLPNPLPNLQPSEFIKIGLILYLAFLFDRKQNVIKDFKEGYLPFAIISGIICFLVAIQPDFGTTMILVIISGIMFFVAGGNLLHIAGTFVMGMLLSVAVAMNKQYIYERFTTFIDPFQDELGAGYHIIQSLTAIGSGGFLGKGFGASRFKYEGYLPEAQGDSIFAIAAEELGFIRIIFIVIGFLIIAWQGFNIAKNAKNNYGKYVAVGITTWITTQAFINIMVVLSLFPTTGVPLPFISYGGSALMSNLLAIGILINIAKYNRDGDSRTYNRKVWSTKKYKRLKK